MSSTRDRIIAAIIAHMAPEGTITASHAGAQAQQRRAERCADRILEIVEDAIDARLPKGNVANVPWKQVIHNEPAGQWPPPVEARGTHGFLTKPSGTVPSTTKEDSDE